MSDQALENYDAIRVTDLLSTYAAGPRALVRITLPSEAFFYGSFVEVRFTLSPLSRASACSGATVKLAECAADWSEIGGAPCTPVNVTSAEAWVGTVAARVLIRTTPGSTGIWLVLPESYVDSDPVVVRLVTPSVYRLLAERVPFRRTLLSLRAWFPENIVCGQVFLSHPKTLSLRCRRDNSEYHSLAYGAENGHVTKITFFPSSCVEMRYYFGSNETRVLMAPAVPIYATAMTTIAMGLAALLARGGQGDIASAAFALALVAPFFRVWTGRLILFPSADIHRSDLTLVALIISVTAYCFTLSLTVASFLIWRAAAAVATVDFLAGLAFLAAALGYTVLVRGGVLQHYACDRCGERIRLRRLAFLHRPSRRTVCRRCYQDLASSHETHAPLAQAQ